MTGFLNRFPWATALMAVLVLIAAIVGGAVVIWGAQTGPNGLSFHDYLSYLKDFAFAVGALGIGRGIATGLANHGLGSQPYDPAGSQVLGDGADAATYGPARVAPTPRRGARKPAARSRSKPPARRARGV